MEEHTKSAYDNETDKNQTKRPRFAAIVLAGGRGKRMNSAVPKQYLEISGKPVLYYALKAFQNSKVDTIILVTGKDDIQYCREQIVEKFRLTKIKQIVEGGNERCDSVFNGLCALTDCDYVLIHDGARPFITEKVICDNMSAVLTQKACVTGVPSKDTVKIADACGCVASTPERDRVWIVQTPQTFAYDLVYDAYEKVLAQKHDHVTDDAMIVEMACHVPIHFVAGDYRNIKITTPEDLEVAQVFVGKTC